MATRKKKSTTVEIEPTTVVGTHLTVITDNFGKTTLIWDDEALLQEVRDAINAHETTELVGALSLGEKPKKTAKPKTPRQK